MKKRIIAIILATLMLVSIFIIEASAYTASMSCGWCGNTVYNPYCTKKSAGTDTTQITCVVHSGCKITKRVMYFFTVSSHTGCSKYVLNGNIKKTHPEYTTHSTTGVYYGCTY